MTFDSDRAVWRKSSRSNRQGGNCVEVATGQELIGIRDSKDPDGGTVVLSPAAWLTFVAAVKTGEYDL